MDTGDETLRRCEVVSPSPGSVATPALASAGALFQILDNLRSGRDHRRDCVGGCDRDGQRRSGDSSTSAVAPGPSLPQGPGGGGTPHIVYYLTGYAPDGADITYSLGGSAGSSEQQSGLTVPMTNKATGLPGIRFKAEPGDYLYFSAQNQGAGTLTCKITEDGQIVDQHTSSGSYTIVTCSGTA
jgi:hypothetical protein